MSQFIIQYNIDDPVDAFATHVPPAILGTLSIGFFAAKDRVGENPWGEGATTLEWTLPSPPAFHSYDELPEIKDEVAH